MNNPKTTIIGILLILGSVSSAVADWLSGNSTGISGHISEILSALAGLGLVSARDGGK